MPLRTARAAPSPLSAHPRKALFTSVFSPHPARLQPTRTTKKMPAKLINERNLPDDRCDFRNKVNWGCSLMASHIPKITPAREAISLKNPRQTPRTMKKTITPMIIISRIFIQTYLSKVSSPRQGDCQVHRGTRPPSRQGCPCFLQSFVLESRGKVNLYFSRAIYCGGRKSLATKAREKSGLKAEGCPQHAERKGKNRPDYPD